ncbi:MAG: UPF0280 family protein [Dethiobacteria bacterium]|jgi:ApbE superfamily uncharacterized protein (UPF0280 family)|nr:UPF0280 family protein [Bacillota bacterium]HOP68190.1 UPF0280 family protein [Bacillota bacterium]HPT33060.1 UPF0280 family protein [Bacillota bacterium]
MTAKRFYRRGVQNERFASFQLAVKQTDLWIAVARGSFHPSLPRQVEQEVWRLRRSLELFLEEHPEMAVTLEPYLLTGPAPDLVLEMVRAGNLVGVGPMASVAGAIAERIGRFLMPLSPEVIVENGGDIFISAVEPVLVGVLGAGSSLARKLALLIEPRQTPLGVCTSSGKLGPSHSFGLADAAVALSPSAALADAAATALGNAVRGEEDLEKALELARSIPGLTGALLLCGEKVAAWGDLQLKPL